MIARLMGLRTLSPAALRECMRTGQVAIFDTNRPRDWANAHVPGASNLDPADDPQSVLPQDRDAFLVFYCSGPLCSRAPIAARRARALGYRNVHVLSAGIQGWRAAGLPIEGADSAAAS